MNNIALLFPGQGSQYEGMGDEAWQMSSYANELSQTLV